MRHPKQARGVRRMAQGVQPFHGYVQSAEILQDTDGNWLSCNPLYSEGPITYYDCRKLGIGGGISEPPPPGYCWTETKCVLFSLWCQEHCIPPGGREVTGDWYPCGVCVDFSRNRPSTLGQQTNVAVR